MENSLLKFITSSDNSRRNEIINEINSSQSKAELTNKGQQICAFLEHTKDWNDDKLIKDVYQTKINLLKKQ